MKKLETKIGEEKKVIIFIMMQTSGEWCIWMCTHQNSKMRNTIMRKRISKTRHHPHDHDDGNEWWMMQPSRGYKYIYIYIYIAVHAVVNIILAWTVTWCFEVVLGLMWVLTSFSSVTTMKKHTHRSIYDCWKGLGGVGPFANCSSEKNDFWKTKTSPKTTYCTVITSSCFLGPPLSESPRLAMRNPKLITQDQRECWWN